MDAWYLECKFGENIPKNSFIKKDNNYNAANA